jgi:hypothetical protein
VRGVKSHNGLRTISSQATDDADRGWTRLAESTPGLLTEAAPNSSWSGPARRRPLSRALGCCVTVRRSPTTVLLSRRPTAATVCDLDVLTNSAMLTSPVFRDPRLSQMATFLGSIGIDMRAGVIDAPTVFPGTLIASGSLVVDESMLIAPGDPLHEAAHIALSPPERRATDVGHLTDATGGEELTAISWCWAALLELEIPPEDVFHGTAYKRGDSAMIIDCARRGIYIGFPLLQAWEMAFDERNARLRGVKPFPHMVKWIRG